MPVVTVPPLNTVASDYLDARADAWDAILLASGLSCMILITLFFSLQLAGVHAEQLFNLLAFASQVVILVIEVCRLCGVATLLLALLNYSCELRSERLRCTLFAFIQQCGWHDSLQFICELERVQAAERSICERERTPRAQFGREFMGGFIVFLG